jgi:hypothetical protein
MGRLRRLLIGVVVAVAEVGACSGSLQTSRSDGGRDATTPIDRSMDHAADAGVDARDAGNGCLALDAAVCPGGPQAECQPTWANVLSYPECMGNSTGASGSYSEVHSQCGNYNVRSVIHGDSATTYYYDVDSGALAGEQLFGYSSGPTCYGPVDTLADECCCPPTTPICAADGGTLGDGSAAHD